MTKYILAGGAIHKALDNGKAFIEELVKDAPNKPVRILICLFAVSKDLWIEKFEGDQEFFSKFISNFELELADEEIFTEQVKKSDVVFIRGGYTKPLIELLSRDLSWAQEIEGKIIAGTSAGAEAIAKYYHVTKTNRTGTGLGLLNIKFVPHWESNFFDGEKHNVDWNKIYTDFKNYKEDIELLTLKDGEFRVIYK